MSSIVIKSISRLTGSQITMHDDLLAIEEPLEISLSFVQNSQEIEKSISITMRTPDHDEALAMGFLFTEGIIESKEQVSSINISSENKISIALKDNVSFDPEKLNRHFYTSSSCGVCGKSSIDSLRIVKKNKSKENNIKIDSSIIYSLPAALKINQNVFEQTGGLHASAIFNLEGKLILMNEDVGRHNALDKVIGNALLQNLLPLDDHILLLSGRASFELIQKAYLADIKIIAAIGAPSSLSVELAIENDITLIGFLKNNKLNIYSGENRIVIN